MVSGRMFHLIPSSEKPTWSVIRRFLSSQRNTPANPPLNGTTALLKMLLLSGSKSLGITGFLL